MALLHRLGTEGGGGTEIGRANEVLGRLLDRALQVSVRGYQHARRFAHS
jgi:hypothetical protein